jgi:hypothetical protein
MPAAASANAVIFSHYGNYSGISTFRRVTSDRNDRCTGEMLNEEVIAASVKAKKNYKVFERWLSRSSRRRGCGLVGDSLDSGIDYAIAVC